MHNEIQIKKHLGNFTLIPNTASCWTDYLSICAADRQGEIIWYEKMAAPHFMDL